MPRNRKFLHTENLPHRGKQRNGDLERLCYTHFAPSSQSPLHWTEDLCILCWQMCLGAECVVPLWLRLRQESCFDDLILIIQNQIQVEIAQCDDLTLIIDELDGGSARE